MTTPYSATALPIATAARICPRQIGPLGRSRATLFFSALGSAFAVERDQAERALRFARGRRVVKAHENDDGGEQAGDKKPFYAAGEFLVQVAVAVLTLGFVDAGYSGDWSRIGALSPETEAHLRTAAFVVVPLSAALVWTIGKRRS